MIELKNTCIGVRCPCCSRNIIEYINRFQFSSGTDLICPHCNTPILSIKKKAAGNLSLNCFGCGETHIYSVSAKSFFSDKPASFGCKTNKVDILFTGSYDNVNLALCQLAEEMDELTDKYYSNMKQIYGSLNTAAIRILEKKSLEKRIVCLCGSCEMNVKLSDGGIRLICAHCGSFEDIPVSSEDDLASLEQRRCILIK
ncbi:MAG: hypothetical protein IKT39_00750 [Clostridia bacterium]|nr:hypothetical protein [Clostridia bacterium]